jgi:hypothetical protein
MVLWSYYAFLIYLFYYAELSGVASQINSPKST